MTIDTTKLRELAQNATPGHWTQWEGRGWVHAGTPKANAEGYMAGTFGQICRTDCGDFSDAQEIKNAEYIAAASPATVLALLDELDRLRKVESATLQGEKIGCRCTYAENQTVDAECLYHRAIRSERDRLQAELTAMLEAAPQPPKLSDERMFELIGEYKALSGASGKEARLVNLARAIEREILGGGE